MDDRLPDLNAEWLEADGLGGFASGTVGGFRTRRYHAVLLSARRPPTDRFVLVNGFDAWIETPTGTWPISTQRYLPGVDSPDGATRLESFAIEPWPCWVWRLPDGILIRQELFVRHERSATVLNWSLLSGPDAIRLHVRLFLSGRDYHSLQHENPVFNFAAVRTGQSLTWRSYPDVPAIQAVSDGEYSTDTVWYRHFEYVAECDRGLDHVEDLAAPGVFTWNFTTVRPAVLVLAAEEHSFEPPTTPGEVQSLSEQLRIAETERRAQFDSPLLRAADSYIVRRDTGRTIIAGYPWFTDWGRDTFIALRGLCLATGRLDDAGRMLAAWAQHVSEGMLPNRFPDRGEAPEFNSVDASLWYIIAAHEYLTLDDAVPADRRRAIEGAILSILGGYANGTRFGIRADTDGLLSAGVPGVQLTWMDAKVGDWVVTPRIGKPVEVQALWLNALAIGAQLGPRWEALYDIGCSAFRERFWNSETGGLYDVIDVDHHSGAVDATLRPNQILSIGGLPQALIEGDQARRIVDLVEQTLWTPMGLRSLAPGEPGYAAHYRGGVRERDGAYHQGTVWPWLIGPFVEAWIRVRGQTAASLAEAEQRFIAPLEAHLAHAGLGHVSEIADAEPPHTAGGCAFQAWSLGELLRLKQCVLKAGAPETPFSEKVRQYRAGADASNLKSSLTAVLPE